MQISSRKVFFIISGVAIAITIILLGSNFRADAELKNGAKFGQWIVVCEEQKIDDKKTETVCSLAQETVNEDKKVVTSSRVQYNAKDKNLQFVYSLPLGVALKPGAAIVADKELYLPANFISCFSSGCLAVAELKNEDLQKIVKAKETAIGFMLYNGQTVNVPLNTDGLERGIAALKAAK